MTTKTWAPHPATLAYRVIKYLQELPRGKFVATGPLAQEMCQPSAALITALLKPVEYGLMIREKRGGFYHWSLTEEGYEYDLDDAPALAATKKYEPTKWVGQEKPEVKPTTITETITDDTRWGDTPDPVVDPLPLEGVDMDRVHQAMQDPVPAQAIQQEKHWTDDFRFSWSSDGVLTVEKHGHSVAMHPDEFQKLAKFVDVISRFKP